MVIDFHSHIYPEKIAEKAAQSIKDFYGGIPIRGKGTAEDLIERGKRGGIDRFVVFSAAISPKHVHSINDFLAKSAAEHPEFIPFGTLHGEMEDPEGEINRIIALGIKGIKIHPEIQNFNMDSDNMMKIYALLEGRLPVIFHCGDFRFDNSHPSRLVRVLDAFPGLTVIAAHFGGWVLIDLALESLRKKSCFLDISSSFPLIGLERGAELISIYGAERILFASDYPMWDPGECLLEFNKLKLSAGERDLILSENALRILPSARAQI